MKLSRFIVYLALCEHTKEEPTLEGAKKYDRCINSALKEMVASKLEGRDIDG